MLTEVPKETKEVGPISMAVLCVDALFMEFAELPTAIRTTGLPFTAWELAEAAEGTGVVWPMAIPCESVAILEKVLCIEPSFNPAVGLAAGVDACTFDETWVLAD